ncbi:hypothetical protein [Thiocapsa sp.]|uniref:DedA family protein n=1 Tax=Thiocapsa sp. TaxID=2024551 RepID=UPI0025FF8E48|nr:hypothetical protein [Thiocapsa sp.]
MSLEAEIATTLTSGIASLQPILDRYGLWALFVACMADGFGIPLPGQTILIACALLAATGKMDTWCAVNRPANTPEPRQIARQARP